MNLDRARHYVKRQAVRSSAIRSVGYNASQKILEVEFTDDTIYEFLPVPADLVSQFLAADSKGTFFDEHIRNSFIHRQAQTETVAEPASVEKPQSFDVPDEDLERLKNTWWGLESYMRDYGGRTHEPLVTELVDEGFRLMREGAALEEGGPPVKAWEVWMSIAFAQLYNTAMAAWELAYAGYYIQSQMLARLITDYLAVVWYLPNHHEDAEKWTATRKLPESGDLLQKVFAEDPSVGDKFKDLRGLLNKFAHLDHSGFTILVGEDEDPRTIPIYIGGRFDQRKFQTTARLLFPLFGSIPSARAKLRAGRHPEWEARVARFVQRIANVMDEYDRRGEAEAQQAKADK